MTKHPPALTDNEAARLYITMENSTASVREIEQAVLEALHQAGRLHATSINDRRAWLYEHDDGQMAAAYGDESPSFTRNDPAWHRVGTVVVHDAAAAIMNARMAPHEGTAS